MDQEKENIFKVTDKRAAYTEHSTKSEHETQDSDAPKPEVPPEQQQARNQTQHEHIGTDGDSSMPIPEANFLNLIFSLYVHAQISLGIMPDPITQQPSKDAAQAKYNIDMLGILQEKTKGNLSQEEEQALEQMLYEVRMAYVQVGK